MPSTGIISCFLIYIRTSIPSFIFLPAMPKHRVVKQPYALEISRRELSEDVWFGIGTLLVVEQSSVENRPRGWHTPSYTVMSLQINIALDSRVFDTVVKSHSVRYGYNYCTCNPNPKPKSIMHNQPLCCIMLEACYDRGWGYLFFLFFFI